MTTQEHLLTIVAEECAEVAQRASKALRFGLDEIQPGQPLTNAERIMEEFDDLYAVILMCQNRALLPGEVARRINEKQDKVNKFLTYSAKCGTVA
jgi:NTP pyrophosphatase (non-canonical NTP hydrolase)